MTATRKGIRFLLDGLKVALSNVRLDQTLLDYLRLARRLMGTKEGCAEGDLSAGFNAEFVTANLNGFSSVAAASTPIR